MLCGMVAFAGGVQAASEAYIDAVNAEVSEFTTGEFSLSTTSPWIARADSGASISDVAGFKKFLRSELPGTYILFVRLPEGTQVKIFEDYRDTGDLGKARSDIYDLLYKRR
jgi:hypothetical protein